MGTATSSVAKTKKVSKSKKKNPNKLSITLSKTKYTYNGKAKKPTVVVKVGKKKVNKKYYKVTYKNNKSAGTAKVTIKAKEDAPKGFSGAHTKKYTIKKAKRKIKPEKKAYSAVEGDGAFYIKASVNKGSGKLRYKCAKKDVIKVTKAGKVKVVKKFDRTCKTLSSQTATSIKQASAKVKIRIKATKNYKAAKKTVTVTVHKKSVRSFDSAESIKTFSYPSVSRLYPTYTALKKLTNLNWSIVTKYQMPGLAPTADDDWTKAYIQCNNLCPQGICMAGDYMLTTAYCMDGIHNSCIFVYNNKTGEYLKTLVLKNQKSHVGGITYDSATGDIWVCHSKKDSKTGLYSIERISYADLKKYATGTKQYTTATDADLYQIPTKPSTIAYDASNDCLWVAQFCKDNKEDDDSDEEDTTSEPRMDAYKYNATKDTLTQVRISDNAAEEDYLGVTTEDVTSDETGETAVRVSALLSTTLELTDGMTDTIYTLQAGDILYKVGEIDITCRDQLETVLCSYDAGDTITLEIHRVISDDETDVYYATFALPERGETVSRTTPYFVQGITFSGDKTIFSCSCGRNNTKKNFLSEIIIYDDGGDDDIRVMGEMSADITLPPMVEEVEVVGTQVYMIYESAATTYLEGTDGKGVSTCPIDKIVAVSPGLG